LKLLVPLRWVAILEINNESFSRVPLSVIDGKEEKRTNLDLSL